MTLLDLLSRFGSSPTAAPSGSNISGYTGIDLSNFTPGGVAPQLSNVATPTGLFGTGNGDFLGGLFNNFSDSYNPQTGLMTQGWGGMALSGLQGLGNSYMAMKKFGLAEDMLKENQRQFNINYQAQRKMTNSQMEDRQRARVASNPNAYTPVDEHMKKWGV